MGVYGRFLLLISSVKIVFICWRNSLDCKQFKLIPSKWLFWRWNFRQKLSKCANISTALSPDRHRSGTFPSEVFTRLDQTWTVKVENSDPSRSPVALQTNSLWFILYTNNKPVRIFFETRYSNDQKPRKVQDRRSPVATSTSIPMIDLSDFSITTSPGDTAAESLPVRHRLHKEFDPSRSTTNPPTQGEGIWNT